MNHHVSISTVFLSAALLFSSAKASEEVALVGAESGKWTMDYEAAVKVAAEKKLPLILNFTGSDWCGWCKLMDQKVFAGDAWINYAADQVMLVTIDFPKDKLKVPEAYMTRNSDLKSKFGVSGFPTYVVLDSDGESVLGKLSAGREKTPESFVEEFKGVARFSAAKMEAFAAANPDKVDAYKAAIADFKKVENDLTAWIKTRPVQSDENNKKFAEFQEQLKSTKAKLDEFK